MGLETVELCIPSYVFWPQSSPLSTPCHTTYQELTEQELCDAPWKVCLWGIVSRIVNVVGKRLHLQCVRPGFKPWVGKIPWRRAWQPTPVFLPGESHEQRSLVGYSPWGSRRVRHDWAHKCVCVCEIGALGPWARHLLNFPGLQFSHLRKSLAFCHKVGLTPLCPAHLAGTSHSCDQHTPQGPHAFPLFQLPFCHLLWPSVSPLGSTPWMSSLHHLLASTHTTPTPLLSTKCSYKLPVFTVLMTRVSSCFLRLLLFSLVFMCVSFPPPGSQRERFGWCLLQSWVY